MVSKRCISLYESNARDEKNFQEEKSAPKFLRGERHNTDTHVKTFKFLKKVPKTFYQNEAFPTTSQIKVMKNISRKKSLSLGEKAYIILILIVKNLRTVKLLNKTEIWRKTNQSHPTILKKANRAHRRFTTLSQVGLGGGGVWVSQVKPLGSKKSFKILKNDFKTMHLPPRV